MINDNEPMAAVRAMEQVERELSVRVNFASRHFPLTQMHELRFHHQKAFEDDDLHACAREIGLDVAPFDPGGYDTATLLSVSAA